MEEQQTFMDKTKRGIRKGIKITLVTLAIVLIALFSFYYWGIYERGVMAGKVLRIAEKGVIFKTYEGKIDLETFGAMKNTSAVASTFDFSVEKSAQPVIDDLQKVSLSGERVNLHFIKRYTIFPWRGDTRYFITKVERVH